MYRDTFSMDSLRSSVIELSIKTKEIKAEARDLLAAARAARRAVGEKRLPVTHASSVKYLAKHCGVSAVYDPIYKDIFALLDDAKVRGGCARYHGLAYAFVRGMAYRRCELKTRNTNRVSARALRSVLFEHMKPGFGAEARRLLEAEFLTRIEDWLANLGV